VSSETGHVVVRESGSAWEPESGQFVLGLGDDLQAQPGASEQERSIGLVTPRRGEPEYERGPAEWFEIGCELEAGSPAEARTAYARALELAPDHPGAHLNLGRLLHEEENLTSAEGHYRAALAAEPGSATAAFNLGVVLEDLGKLERAVEAYLRAVASDPELADAHYNLSRLYEATGDRSAALRHLRSYSLLSKTS
jgi:tetratricopeptide (TPR) repeat protein